MTVDVKLLAEWAGALLVISALLGACRTWLNNWGRGLVKEVDSTCERRIEASLKSHNTDPDCHSNHSNIVERRRQVDVLSQHLAAQDVVLARLEERLAAHVASEDTVLSRLEERLDTLANHGRGRS